MSGSKRAGVFVVLFGMTSAAIGCAKVADAPNVEYGPSNPIGRWDTDYAAGGGGDSASAGTPASVAAGATASAGSIAVPSGGAGRAADAGVDAAAGAAGSVAVDHDSGTTSSSTGPTALANLSFDVTTSPVGYRYQPKNIGAIWVQDSNGKLVKSLEVWASIRRRYLTRYASALSGSSVDVTASATLPNHRAHHATWNLKDKTGALAPPGKYTLVIELTDGDLTGRNLSVSFDTSAGPSTSSPADAPSFGSMKLQLQ